MWMFFGALALITTALNWGLFMKGRDFTLMMALAFSFTALTLCAEYSLVNSWVKQEDWSALLDVVPTTHTIVWGMTALLIIVNFSPVLLRKRRAHV